MALHLAATWLLPGVSTDCVPVVMLCNSLPGRSHMNARQAAGGALALLLYLATFL